MMAELREKLEQSNKEIQQSEAEIERLKGHMKEKSQ